MLGPYLVDAHCHLGDAAFDRDRDAVLVRARAAGVGHVVVIGGTIAESERGAPPARGGARPLPPPRGGSPPGRGAGPAGGAPPCGAPLTPGETQPLRPACPHARVVVGTAAPYLAPVPHRGTRNEPAFVRYGAAALARIRGEALDPLGQRSTENARRLFGSRLAATL